MLTRGIGRCCVLSMTVVALSITAPMRTHAASNGPITGGYTVTQLSPGAVPVELLTGLDGTVWFLNAQDQLGTVSSSGVTALTGVTLPHGALLISAGPEGEWAIVRGSPFSGGCIVALAEPGGHVLQRVLNHPASPYCSGAARDKTGNLWVSVHGRPSAGMAEITPAGVIRVTYAPLLFSSVALGTDGALWTFERVNSSPTFTFSYGHFVPDGPVTTVPVDGTQTPPVPGSPYGLLVRPNEDSLLARPDGTFWLPGINVALSSPAHWFIEFRFQGESGDVETSDGALWTVGLADADTQERIERIDQWGVIDRGAVLPISPRNGSQLLATGPIAALSDGSILFTASDGAANFVVHYVPTQLPNESIWTGTAGGGKWSTPGNWLNNGVPKNGSIVVLRGSGVMTDDLPGLQPVEILAYGTVHLSGDALALGSYGVQVTGGSTSVVIDDPITIAPGTTLPLRADPFATLTLGGVISGAGGVTTLPVAGLQRGLVELTGNNTYSGVTLVQGPLRIDGDQPSSTVDNEDQLFGGGTTGPVINNGAIGLIYAPDQSGSYSLCPQTLTVDGNIVFTAASGFNPDIEVCGSPSVQTIGSVLVTGTVTIDKGAALSLHLDGDKPQLACLLSSQGALVGEFAGVKEGSTIPDPSGGKAVFSYKAPSGAGCYPSALTVKTGVH